MKKQFSVFFLLISISIFSQSAENLKTATKKFYQANYLLDFDGIALLSYPKLVEIIGAENIQDKVEQHFENDEFRLRFQLETVPFQFGEIKKIDGKSFCVMTCRNPIRYTFEEKLNNDAALKKTAWLQETNKTKEVIFEPKRNSFNVTKITTLVAVSDETTSNQWKFFNFDVPEHYQIFQKLFGETTKKELGL